MAMNIQNKTFYIFLALLITTTCLAVTFFILWLNYDCPGNDKTIEQVNEKYIEQLTEISNAETKDDIDSLLRELYGFDSN